MSNTFVRYTASAGQTQFDLTFPYLNRDHVVAQRNFEDVTYTWVSSTRIALDTPADAGDIIVIERNTPVETPEVQFTSTSVLTDAELNRNTTQLIYKAQELEERTVEATDSEAIDLSRDMAIEARNEAIAAQEAAEEARDAGVAAKDEAVSAKDEAVAAAAAALDTLDDVEAEGAVQIAAIQAEATAQTANVAQVFQAQDFTSNTAALAKGVTGLASLVAGSGGTDGTFNLAFTGDGTGAAGVFTVAGGAVVYAEVTAPGYGYTTAPTVSFAASAGLTGASATAVIAQNRPAGTFWRVASGGSFEVFENVAGVATSRGKYSQGSSVPCSISLSTANIFSMSPAAGYTAAAEKVFHGFAAGINSGPVTISIAGINGGAATPVVMPNGDPLPARTLITGYPFAVRFSSTLSKYVLVEGHQPYGSRINLRNHGSSTGNTLIGIVANGGEKVRNDLANQTLELIAPSDKPLGSASLTIYAADGTTALFSGVPLYDIDGVTSPPLGAWKTGDLLQIRRNSTSGAFYLVQASDRITTAISRWVTALLETGQVPSEQRPVMVTKVGENTYFVDVYPHNDHYTTSASQRRSSDLVRFVIFDMADAQNDIFVPALNSVFSRYGGHWTHHTNFTFDDLVGGITTDTGMVPSTFETVLKIGPYADDPSTYHLAGIGHNNVTTIAGTIKLTQNDPSTGNVDVVSADLKAAPIGSTWNGDKLVVETDYTYDTLAGDTALEVTIKQTIESASAHQVRVQVTADGSAPGLEVACGITEGSYVAMLPGRDVDTVCAVIGGVVGDPVPCNLGEAAPSIPLGNADRVYVWDSDSLRPDVRMRLSLNYGSGITHKLDGEDQPYVSGAFGDNAPWGFKVYIPIYGTVGGKTNLSGKVLTSDYSYTVIRGDPV